MSLVELALIITISTLSIFVLNALAPRIGLLDVPDERKSHAYETPLVGGIAIYLATLFACLIVFPLDSLTLQLFLLSCGMIVLLGALDDQRNLGVPVRLVSQILITGILVFYSGSYIHFLGDILAIGAIDLGQVGILFTFVATLSLINAFNWNDGIDGLAGSLALNAFVSLALLFSLSGIAEFKVLPLILAVSVIPFLFFNLGLVPGPVRKVFMGDAGSMFIGLSIIWLFVLGTQGAEKAFRPVTAVWVVAIPLWDLTSTFYRRIRRRQSPFMAGRDHLHHLLVSLGLSARQALSVIVFISVLASMIAIAGEIFQIPEYIMLAIYVTLFFAYHFSLSRLWSRVLA